MLSLYFLLVTMYSMMMRPRIVVYNLTQDELRPILAELARRLDPGARWAGESLVHAEVGRAVCTWKTRPLSGTSNWWPAVARKETPVGESWNRNCGTNCGAPSPNAIRAACNCLRPPHSSPRSSAISWHATTNRSRHFVPGTTDEQLMEETPDGRARFRRLRNSRDVNLATFIFQPGRLWSALHLGHGFSRWRSPAVVGRSGRFGDRDESFAGHGGIGVSSTSPDRRPPLRVIVRNRSRHRRRET